MYTEPTVKTAKTEKRWHGAVFDSGPGRSLRRIYVFVLEYDS